MALPKITTPVFDVTIPSSKKKIKVRPMLVKEEKILLIARESGDQGDILNAIKQVVNNCIMDDDFDINKLCIFDLEFLFIRLRAISINNITRVAYKDNEDEKIYQFDINLDEVKVIFPENIDKKIVINDETGVTLKYPDTTLYTDTFFLNKSETELFEHLIINCIETVFDGDKVYYARDFNKEELIEFIENLDVNTFNKFREFTSNLPKVEYVIKYKNDFGNERKIVLNALNDFFSLG
jgi:hypothetical protein